MGRERLNAGERRERRWKRDGGVSESVRRVVGDEPGDGGGGERGVLVEAVEAEAVVLKVCHQHQRERGRGGRGGGVRCVGVGVAGGESVGREHQPGEVDVEGSGQSARGGLQQRGVSRGAGQRGGVIAPEMDGRRRAQKGAVEGGGGGHRGFGREAQPPAQTVQRGFAAEGNGFVRVFCSSQCQNTARSGMLGQQ